VVPFGLIDFFVEALVHKDAALDHFYLILELCEPDLNRTFDLLFKRRKTRYAGQPTGEVHHCR
jgi:hypothetical protein